MDLVIPKAKLVDLAESAVSCVSPKSSTSQLRMARVELRGSELSVVGTDLMRTIEARANCDARQMGAVLVDAKRLLECARALPAAPVRIVADAKALTLSAEKRKFSLETVRVEDYPHVEAWPERAKTWTMPSEALRRLVKRAQHAASTDTTRPHLNCVALEEHAFKRSGKLSGKVGSRASATDGYRLAAVHGPERWGGPKALVPEAAVSLLLSLADRGDTVEFASVSDSAMHARCGDRSIRIAVYDAQQPPIEQVIPSQSAHCVTVERSVLRNAIAAISRASSAATGSIVLTFSAGHIRVEAASNDSGGVGGDDEVACEGGPGEPVKIGMNAKYLLDPLDAFDCETVAVDFGGELDPVVFRDPDLIDDVLIGMPMRI
jgi:DNA polymerase-3 subunit beta